MKLKRIIPVLGIVTIMGATGAVSFASGDDKADSSTTTGVTQEFGGRLGNGTRECDGTGRGNVGNRGIKCGRGFNGERAELTEEEIAERKARRTECLSQALAEGRISQEEYDQMINQDFPGQGQRKGMNRNSDIEQKNGLGQRKGNGQNSGKGNDSK